MQRSILFGLLGHLLLLCLAFPATGPVSQSDEPGFYRGYHDHVLPDDLKADIENFERTHGAAVAEIRNSPTKNGVVEYGYYDKEQLDEMTSDLDFGLSEEGLRALKNIISSGQKEPAKSELSMDKSTWNPDAYSFHEHILSPQLGLKQAQRDAGDDWVPATIKKEPEGGWTVDNVRSDDWRLQPSENGLPELTAKERAELAANSKPKPKVLDTHVKVPTQPDTVNEVYKGEKTSPLPKIPAEAAPIHAIPSGDKTLTLLKGKSSTTKDAVTKAAGENNFLKEAGGIAAEDIKF